MLLSDFLLGKPRIKKKKIIRVGDGGYLILYRPQHPRARINGYVLFHYYMWERYHHGIP